MAARLNKLDTDRVLERIKLSQLLNRLQYFALGEVDPANKKPVVLSKTEVHSITWLLERRLARAEAPKDINLRVSLEELITKSRAKVDDSGG